MLNLVILPLGCDDSSILRHIKEGLLTVYPNLSCSVGPESKRLLEGCFNSKRKQYNAASVIQKLNLQIGLYSADYLLGVTDVDLYVPNMNFVFGLADMSRRAGVISLNRLKPDAYGGTPNRTLYVDRAVKEAIHEMGHVFGLAHCSRSRCVMFFSNSISDTDRKSREFCSLCKEDIDNILG